MTTRSYTLNPWEFIVETCVPIRAADGWLIADLEMLLHCEFDGPRIAVRDAAHLPYERKPELSERWLVHAGDELSLALFAAVQRWAETPEGQARIRWEREAMLERNAA